MSHDLRIYQQVLLLSLRDDRGTVPSGVWVTQGIAGGVLVDLLLAGRISLEGKRNLVNLESAEPTDDPVLDACLLRIGEAKRRASAQAWVQRLASTRNFHAAADRLCDLGLVRSDRRSVLLFFSKRAYPEIDPGPERAIVEDLRSAIFDDRADVTPRVAALAAIANAIDLLRHHFPKRELKTRKQKLKSLTQGDEIGAATSAAIQAVIATIVAATVAASAASAAG